MRSSLVARLPPWSLITQTLVTPHTLPTTQIYVSAVFWATNQSHWMHSYLWSCTLPRILTIPWFGRAQVAWSKAHSQPLSQRPPSRSWQSYLAQAPWSHAFHLDTVSHREHLLATPALGHHLSRNGAGPQAWHELPNVTTTCKLLKPM